MNRRFVKGMTLIEVTVSFFVILVVGVAVSGIFAYNARMEKRDYAMTEADHLAVFLLENIDSEVDTSNEFNNLKSTDYLLFSDIDKPYIYKVDVDEVTPYLKYVGVSIYHRDIKQTEPLPDTSTPKGGRVLKMGTYVSRP